MPPEDNPRDDQPFDKDDYEQWENENKPIGRCPKCGTPIYTDEGFCGTCNH